MNNLDKMNLQTACPVGTSSVIMFTLNLFLVAGYFVRCMNVPYDCYEICYGQQKLMLMMMFIWPIDIHMYEREYFMMEMKSADLS